MKMPSPLSKSCYFWDSKGAFLSYRILGSERSQKCNLSFLSFPQIFLWKIWNSFTWNQCIQKSTKIFEKIEKNPFLLDFLKFWDFDQNVSKTQKKCEILIFFKKFSREDWRIIFFSSESWTSVLFKSKAPFTTHFVAGGVWPLKAPFKF